MRTTLFLLIAVILLPVYVTAQPFTKNYIMSIGMCDTNCTSPLSKEVNLLESDDGADWTVVPNYIPYGGGVPDVIIRGSKLYIYTPTPYPSGWVKRYDLNDNTWDANTVPVSIKDSANNTVEWVDPSTIIDSSGNIVLFFMNTTGISGDPAFCATYPCTRYFESAVEVPGSDGTQFIKSSGHRVSITLQDTIDKRASDPDLFFDGTQYVLYITKANGMLAYYSDKLHGSYTMFPNLPNGFISNQGNIVGCGYYDSLTNNYWTYIHAVQSGKTVIKRAVHANYNVTLKNFTTIITGDTVGDAKAGVESPAFCTNDFLTITSIHSFSKTKNDYLIFCPNPVKDNIEIETPLNTNIEIISLQGQILKSIITKNKTTTIDLTNYPPGIFFIKAKTDKKIIINKLLKQ